MSYRLFALSSLLLPSVLLLPACSSDNISDPPTLTKTINEPAGSNCSQGGQRIESGPDINRNGVLESTEVNSISYRCNGDAEVNIKVLGGTESSGQTQIQFTLAEPVANEASFNYSSADAGAGAGNAIVGTDYQAGSGSVSFAPGETSKTISFGLLDDDDLEGGEIFHVNLSNPVNATLPSTQIDALIVDDELNTVDLVETELQTYEADAQTITVSISLSESQSLAISQGFELAGSAEQGQDYSVSANTFELAAGQTQASIDISITDDAIAEGNETIELNLIESGNGVLGDKRSLTIQIKPTLQRLYTGSRHACALSDDNALKCWGLNTQGQLGILSNDSRGNAAGELGENLPLVDLGNFAIDSLALANQHSCAMSNAGAVKCWGNNNAGQLGRDNIHVIGGASVANSNYDAEAPEDNEASDSCDEVNNTTLPGKCLFGDRLTPIELGSGVTVTQLVAGFEHTCVLLSNQSVKCWGGNIYGQLGNDSQENIGDGFVPNPNYDAENGNSDNEDSCLHTNVKELPVTCDNVADSEMGDSLQAVNLGANATKLAAGAYHTCALVGSDSLKCWGFNGSGQLGLGDTNNRGDGLIVNPNYQPTGSDPEDTQICDSVEERFIPLSCDSNISTEMGAALATVNLGQGIVDIEAGLAHTCVRLVDQSVRCWGSNGSGQLAQGNTDNLGSNSSVDGSTPAAMLGAGLNVNKLAVGGGHNCAIFADNSVKCWGLNSSGQLGLGDTDNRGISPETSGDMLSALSFAEGTQVQQLSLGQAFSCALVTQAGKSETYCWGNGLYGQIGSGSTDNQSEISQTPLAIF